VQEYDPPVVLLPYSCSPLRMNVAELANMRKGLVGPTQSDTRPASDVMLQPSMQIFVINLKRSVKRRRLITRQLERLGLAYRIFEATDGATLTPTDIIRYTDNHPDAAGMSLSQLGCAISHQRIYETMVEEGIASALILEDDLLLSASLPTLIPALEQQLTDDELILLYFVPGRGCQLTTAGEVELPGGLRLCYPMSMRNVLSATAYMLRNETAAGLVRAGRPIRVCADCWGNFHVWGGLGRLRVVRPSPIELRSDLPSEIGLGRLQNPLLRPFLDLVNRYDLFPFNRLLTWNRARTMATLQQMCTLTDQPSVLQSGTPGSSVVAADLQLPAEKF